MKYAGIGSRETPSEILNIMIANGSHYAYKGYTLRSGKAIGADQNYERGARLQKGKVELFTADSHLPKWTHIFTEFFHPYPYRLTIDGWKLMCRNAMIILGENGDDPVDFVECYTPEARVQGGTAQGIRIANYFKIPVYNLGDPDYDRQTTLL